MNSDPPPQHPPEGEQSRLFENLRDPACYSHPVPALRVIETHISFVVLTGLFAYKIKKAVNLGFLDFTSLEKRLFYCSEELRLNARLAPEIYLDVVPISGTTDAPQVGGTGEPIEYAVRMREFAQEALADNTLARGEFTPQHVDALAAAIANFHVHAACASETRGFGAPETVLAAALQNFDQIRPLAGRTASTPLLATVEAWTRREYDRLHDVFAKRQREGCVRECHGDLHLGNIVFLNGVARPFDCIEFNPVLCWIDVINEISFLAMDLEAAGRADLARRFLNAYLEATGDYDGLAVLRFYCAYRAMVRAKVMLMRADQQGSTSEGRTHAASLFRSYLGIAAGSAQRHRSFVLITHGFSGSGKTTLTQPLLELSGAIRIRSDIERKRIHGLAPTENVGSGIAEGLYRSDTTENTYNRLKVLARTIVEAGHGVIVDATFLQHRHREMFRELAKRLRVPFLIIDFRAAESDFRERIVARNRTGQDASDANLAVLEHQLKTHDPLQADELDAVCTIDTSEPATRAVLPQTWAPLLQQLARLHG